MPVTLHWFLPTNGDSRADLSLGNAVGAAGSRVAADGSSDDRPSTTSRRSPGIALGWLVGLAITAVFGILQIVQVQAAQRRDGRLLLKDGDFFRA